MLNFCDFILVYVFTTNHHLKPKTTNQRTIEEMTKICTIYKKRYIYISFLNPLYTCRLFHCNIMDESICDFRGVRSVLSVLFFFFFFDGISW